MLPTGLVTRVDWRTISGIAVGGALGALARAAAIEVAGGFDSWALVVVNVLGSFVLGVAVIRMAHRPDVLASLGIGFCGGLTSMSTFAVDVAGRIDSGEISGVIIAGATIAGAVGGAALGMFVAGDPRGVELGDAE